MQFFEYEEDRVIEENQNWFRFFVKFPLIMATALAIIFFIWGIVDPSAIQIKVPEFNGAEIVETTKYGIMQTQTSVGATIIWWLIGAVVTAINYFTLKIILSPMILNIYYLKKIKTNTGKMVSQKTTVKSESQQKFSVQAWVCPKCGEKNSYSAKNCINCFEPKP